MGKIKEKYFQNSDMQATKVEDLLFDDETVLWRGKPRRASYITVAIIRMLPIVLLWILFDGGFIFLLTTQASGMPVYLVVIISVFFVFHLAPVWIWVAGIIKAVNESRNMEYGLSDRRIFVRTGVIGIDFKTIMYSEIESVNTRVGLIDKWFHVGDVYINAKSQSAVLYDIPDPYFIGTKLQKIVLDISSDIHFPNALRPESNPGFHTKYTGSISQLNDSYKATVKSDRMKKWAEKKAEQQASDELQPEQKSTDAVVDKDFFKR